MLNGYYRSLGKGSKGDLSWTSNEMNHVNYFNIGGLLIYQIGDGANVNVINSITVEGPGVCLQHSSIPRKCAPVPIWSLVGDHQGQGEKTLQMSAILTANPFKNPALESYEIRMSSRFPQNMHLSGQRSSLGFHPFRLDSHPNHLKTLLSNPASRWMGQIFPALHSLVWSIPQWKTFLYTKRSFMLFHGNYRCFKQATRSVR